MDCSNLVLNYYVVADFLENRRLYMIIDIVNLLTQ